MKIHLVTYGDEKYTLIKAHFIWTAINSSFFDKIHSFSNLDIEPEFYHEVYEPVKYRRGGGYWLWKPYFVKRVMDLIDDGDILIYCDSGSMINGNACKRFWEYIELVKDSKTGTLAFELAWKEYQYTKREVFIYFKSPPEIINSNQLMATVLIFKKCMHSVLSLDQWFDLANTKPYLFTDQQVVQQMTGFIDHRHDQSIFSLIRKNRGSFIIPDETTYGPYVKGAERFPFWTTQFKP